ncbi:MAG TPA: hypothetical protein VNO21_22195 [Polyangiaceae bacterium]|nr:hypothetical protein [Polyangiaceae bacterium]
MRFALGISVHTGWAACVVAGGSLHAPQIEVREEIEILGDDERFLFHRAAEVGLPDAHHAIEGARVRATTRAGEAIRRVVDRRDIAACAIVAKGGLMPEPLEFIFAAHVRLHAAEGCFYRDVLRAAVTACGLTVRIVAPSDFDTASALVREIGKRVGSPWGKDQKLAALAAWGVL